MKQVLTFSSPNPESLETNINDSLRIMQDKGFVILDVQYQLCCTRDMNYLFGCMVFYKKEDSDAWNKEELIADLTKMEEELKAETTNGDV